VDTLLENSGGFGRFQWFITITYILVNKSTMLILMGMAFLTKVPEEYMCEYQGKEGSPEACKPADFCSDPSVVSYTPNMDLPNAYYNWVLRYDLHCASGTKIGLIGSAPFIGWVLTSTFLPRLSDVYYGRQRMMLFGYIVTFLTYTVMFTSTSYSVLIGCMFVMGLMATIRVQVSVMFLYEIFSRAQYQRVYTSLAMFEGVAGVFAALYFKYLSKDANGLMFISYMMLCIGTIASFFYPEAPRYLVKSNQIDRAQEVFEKIANYNLADTAAVSKERVRELFRIESSHIAAANEGSDAEEADNLLGQTKAETSD